MNSPSKPHKGTLAQATRYEYADGEYVYTGRFLDHPNPQFRGQRGHTSLVVAEEGDEIETLNSRYTLIRKIDT